MNSTRWIFLWNLFDYARIKLHYIVVAPFSRRFRTAILIEFQKDRLKNVGAVGGRIFGFPIDLAHRLYNSLLLSKEPGGEWALPGSKKAAGKRARGQTSQGANRQRGEKAIILHAVMLQNLQVVRSNYGFFASAVSPPGCSPSGSFAVWLILLPSFFAPWPICLPLPPRWIYRWFVIEACVSVYRKATSKRIITPLINSYFH